MSIEEKIAEIISNFKGKCTSCQGMPEHYCNGVCDIDDAKEIISLFRIEVDCTECRNGYIEGISKLGSRQKQHCPHCTKGKITKAPESGDRGIIL